MRESCSLVERIALRVHAGGRLKRTVLDQGSYWKGCEKHECRVRSSLIHQDLLRQGSICSGFHLRACAFLFVENTERLTTMSQSFG